MLSNLNRRRFLRTAAGVFVPAPFVIGQSLRNPAFVARLTPSGVTPAQIQTNLISFWRLEEDNDTRLDSFGTNHLTQSGTINRRTGKTNYGSDHVAANSRTLSKTDNAGLRTGDVDFTIVATGTAPLAYQWIKGASAITDATNATYTISSCVLTDAGSYSCTVTNAYGSATSAAAVLTVDDLKPRGHISGS